MRIKVSVTLGLTGLVLVAGLCSSYGQVFWNRAVTAIDESVPIQYELERVKTLAESSEKSLDSAITELARRDVALRDQQARVKDLESKQMTRLADLRTLREALRQSKAGERVSLSGRDYQESEIASDLKRGFAVFEQGKHELEAQRALLETRLLSLKTAEESLASTRQRLRELELARAQLGARLEKLKASKEAGELELDNSALVSAEKALQRARERLAVKEAEAERRGAGKDEGLISLDGKAADASILDKVDAALGEF